MSSSSSLVRPAKLVLRGIHLDLTDAMRASLETKADRLFRHEPAIIQLRIDVACEPTRAGRTFEARGYIDIAGPDLAASTRNDDAYAAISLLIGKLDRMLRKRATSQRRHRHAEDIRVHAPELQSVGGLG